MKNIPYGRQHITQQDIDAVSAVLQGDFLTQGPAVEQFENAFGQHVHAPHAVAVANGTAALHLCAMALDVKPGDKWLTTPISFVASGNCILYCGGQVDFVDIDPATLTMDLNQLEDKVKTGKYKGVIPVDFAGYPVRMDAVKSLADRYGLKIIEDACHAPGGYFTDEKEEIRYCGDGQYADLAIFSFHPVKHIACGEGGMVTGSKQSLVEKVKLLRTHGITRDPNKMHANHGGWYMEMQELGYNYRMPDVLCALGSSQLTRAEEGLVKRREIARRYSEAFAGLNLSFTHVPEGVGHAYHLYVITTTHRKQLYDFLREKGVFAQVHYIPMHTMPYYKNMGFKQGDFPKAEKYYEDCLSLPMYPSLSAEDQDYVIGLIKDFLQQH
ncbi:MAG: UDP-4-amino-4,6-dideoxy-N-acetyl-beta-L-altrosamine transaminase [Bacteroidetes bacterium]|nr:UDP-4-amino-4,6-dideoxy-N-acetyl-beta-L-altrosamine transaminase [Bacteroidota bacterium]